MVMFGSFDVSTSQRNMGDSACLVQQPFCYASGISNEANESNPIHALGQSISFGRFTSESLAWEKWSTFSHNRYVEEAERYTRPGSVAQKKAFFEAHYKKLAAQRAAALLEQANNATEQEHEAVVDTSPKSKLVLNEEDAKVLKSEPDAMLTATGYDSNSNIEASLPESSKVSGTTPMDTPIPKQGSNSDQEVLQMMGKKKPPVSSFKLLKAIGTPKFTSTPVKSTAPIFSTKDNIATPMSNKPALSSADKKRSTPKLLYMSVNFTPIRELNRLTASIMRKFESTRVSAGSSKASKDSSPPTMASKSELQKQSSLTPFTENKRDKMTSSIISSPFSLRTKERAARRKKKLEEKFNANEAQKVQLRTKLKEKSKTEIRKLRLSFCFKARPVPDFYKEREASNNETKKDPLTQSESPKLGKRPTPSVVESKTSLPPQRPSLKNNGNKNFKGKNGRTLTHPFTSNSTMITTSENTSPNIQHVNQNDRNYC